MIDSQSGKIISLFTVKRWWWWLWWLRRWWWWWWWWWWWPLTSQLITMLNVSGRIQRKGKGPGTRCDWSRWSWWGFLTDQHDEDILWYLIEVTMVMIFGIHKGAICSQVKACSRSRHKKTSNYNCSFFKFKSGINTRTMCWYRATMPAKTNFYPQKPSLIFFLRPSNSVTLLKQNSHKLSPENQLRSKATFMSCDEVAVKTEIKGNPCALLVVHKTLLW